MGWMATSGEGTVKRLRGALLVAGIFGLLIGALFWSMPLQGFRTPEDCVAAYREASLAGDIRRYLACLAEPLRLPDSTAFRPRAGIG